MSLPYRENVCIILHNSEGKVLLGERHNNPGVFQFPQGGVEDGTLEENVYREIKEELGIDRAFVEIRARLQATHQYDFAQVPDYALGKFRGQAQTFWLVSFKGDERNIDLAADEHQEFMSYKWVPPGQVLDIAEARRRDGYEAPIREVEEILGLL